MKKILVSNCFHFFFCSLSHLVFVFNFACFTHFTRTNPVTAAKFFLHFAGTFSLYFRISDNFLRLIVFYSVGFFFMFGSPRRFFFFNSPNFYYYIFLMLNVIIYYLKKKKKKLASTTNEEKKNVFTHESESCVLLKCIYFFFVRRKCGFYFCIAIEWAFF